jgi:hypothetical protein
VRLRSEYMPNAELYKPVVRLPRASCPSAVLPPGKAESGACGTTPKDFGVVHSGQKASRESIVNVRVRFFIS